MLGDGIVGEVQGVVVEKVGTIPALVGNIKVGEADVFVDGSITATVSDPDIRAAVVERVSEGHPTYISIDVM